MRKSIAAACAAALFITAHADAHDDVTHRFDSVDQGTAYVTRLRSSGASAGSLELDVEIFGRGMRLLIEPVNVYAPGARVVRVGEDGESADPVRAATYRGSVANETGSLVAVSFDGTHLEGLVLSGSDVFFLSPVGSGTHSALRADAGALGFSSAPRSARATGPSRLLEVAAVGDFEFFQLHGVGSNAEIATVMNQVDAVYIDQLDTTVSVIASMVFDTAADPFSVFNTGNLFNDFRSTATEFGDWRATQGGDIAGSDIAHLFSDKFGINAGFAFINTLCSTSRGVGVSTTNFQSLHALIINHEIGHNFGAPHDGEAGTCSATPQNQFIMSPAATGLTFSPCSLGIMTPARDQAPCIGAFVPTTTTTLPPQVCGDATGDGSLAATDALLTLQTGVGAGSCELCVCDVNLSGGVNATDALLVLQGSVGQQVGLMCIQC